MWDAVTLEALGGSDELSISNLDSRKTSIENQYAKPPSPPRPLPPVASKSYSVASVWEVKAPLSEIQQRAIEVVSASVSTPPLPPHLASLQPMEDQRSNEVEQTAGNERHSLAELSNGLGERSFDESVALQNSSEFFKWLSELEGIRAREAEERFAGHASALQRWIQECNELLATVDGMSAMFEELKDGQRRVNERTAALHETCERLVADRQHLLSTADGLSAKLTYFDELERISAQFHATALNDKEEDILQSLVRLDECLKFIKAHSHFADAPAYLAKYTQLQIKAHAAVRTKIRQGLLNAAQGCLALGLQVKEQPEKDDEEDLLAELTLLNVRFRAAAHPSVGVLLKGIEETSASSSEYEQLLQACITSYSEARLVVLKPLVTKYLKQADTKIPSMLLRDGWTFLLQVAQLELQLFTQFFPHQTLLISRKDNQSLSPPPASQILEPLGAILSGAVRQSLVPIKDVDQLSEVALVLRSEVIRTQSSSDKQLKALMDDVDRPEVVLMHGAFRKLLSELQQKMVQRAHSMVRDSIIRFKPVPNDVNYPGILVEEDNDERHTHAGKIDARRGWYPPVSLTVTLLTGLHPVLDTPAFNDIAHESLTGAIAAVQEASRAVTTSAGHLHGLLFVVRQLLLLRLHIPKQDCDVSMDVGTGNFLLGQERKGGLDFDHVQDYLKRAISGRLFSGAGAKQPSLERNSGQRQFNPMLELDRAVKGACENLIISMTKLSVEPALNFLTKVTAVYGKERPNQLRGQGGSESGDNPSQQRRPLREHAFATPERTSEIVKSVNTLIEKELPTILQLLKAYVPAEEREHTLCVPLKSNIHNALTQMATLVEAEYTCAEVESMGLLSTEEVDKLFISV